MILLPARMARSRGRSPPGRVWPQRLQPGVGRPPSDARLQALRPHPGQVVTARRLRAILAGSEIIEVFRNHRLQDPLSLRCIPQVHGAVRDCLDYVVAVLDCEINSVTDNPVFIPVDGPEGEELQALPGGNGHGAPVATALDCLAIAIAELSTMSQVRSDRLTNSHLSELPPFLVAGSGASSGFMIPPYVAAALAAENRAHAAPATVHTVSTCAGQEDHVSMGTTAAIKARRAAWNAGHILAVELLCAAQALDFHAPRATRRRHRCGACRDPPPRAHPGRRRPDRPGSGGGPHARAGRHPGRTGRCPA